MRTIQRRRKSRFLFLRSRYAYFQPRSTFSLAAFHSLERAPNAPLACLRTCFFRLRRGTFDTARGMIGSCYAAWMRRLIRFCSPFVAIVVARRRFRFRFEVFLVRMWLLNAFERFTFPVPVTEKRFFAPRWLFIFGITRTRSFRRENHRHRFAFHLRIALDLRDIREIGGDSVHYSPPQLRVCDLTTAKHESDLDLVALTEKPAGMARLRLEVVFLDPRAVLHFLEMDHVWFFFALGGIFVF